MLQLLISQCIRNLQKVFKDTYLTWQNYTQDYLYDPVGNIVQMAHKVFDPTVNGWTRNYFYETINNRLKNTKIGQGVNSFSYTYPHHPQHGFITGMPHLQKMEWNFKDELKLTALQKVNNGNPETTFYVYDNAGQRIRKITENAAGQKIKERIYLGNNEIYFEYKSNAEDLKRETLHVIDDKQRIAMIETLTRENGNIVNEILVRYQFGNHLGSACLETDDNSANPNIISYEEFHPYGTTSYQAVNKDIKAAAKRYRYTGMERDEESGLNYHGARYYMAWLGRWLSCDPDSIIDGLDIYNYVKSNPVRLADPNGKGTGEGPLIPSGHSEETPTAEWPTKVVTQTFEKWFHFAAHHANKIGAEGGKLLEHLTCGVGLLGTAVSIEIAYRNEGIGGAIQEGIIGVGSTIIGCPLSTGWLGIVGSIVFDFGAKPASEYLKELVDLYPPTEADYNKEYPNTVRNVDMNRKALIERKLAEGLEAMMESQKKQNQVDQEFTSKNYDILYSKIGELIIQGKTDANLEKEYHDFSQELKINWLLENPKYLQLQQEALQLARRGASLLESFRKSQK